ncbi:MAG: VanZ family protein [Proteocatella sp.]
MKKKYITWSILILMAGWIGLIFYFSSQGPAASHGQSGWAVEIFNRLNAKLDITDTELFKKASYFVREVLFKGRYETPNAIMRKSAHFGIYLVLGMITCLFSYMYGRRYLLAGMLGVSFPVLIAVLDEYNQKFTGRTSSLEDVLLDGSGALLGTCLVLVCILICMGIMKMKARYISKKRKHK